ncbi:MAG: hypothetical protein R3C49_27850 [Planctomycetaceae bacterium]
MIGVVDPVTRTRTVLIDLDDGESAQLADGQLIRMQLEESIPTEGFQVPITSLASGSRGLWAVYAAEPVTAELRDSTERIVRSRPVEVLHSDAQTAVVRGALKSGDLIVADGVHRVVPGQRVTAATAESL